MRARTREANRPKYWSYGDFSVKKIHLGDGSEENLTRIDPQRRYYLVMILEF